MLHLVSGNDRHFRRNIKDLKRLLREVHSAAGCDRPRDASLSEEFEQILRPREGPHFRDLPGIGFRVALLQLFYLFGGNFASGFPQQGIHKQSTTHTNAAMNAPDGELDAAALQGFSPRQHVLINAVYQRSIKIEKKGGRIGSLFHVWYRRRLDFDLRSCRTTEMRECSSALQSDALQ